MELKIYEVINNIIANNLQQTLAYHRFFFRNSYIIVNFEINQRNKQQNIHSAYFYLMVFGFKNKLFKINQFFSITYNLMMQINII